MAEEESSPAKPLYPIGSWVNTNHGRGEVVAVEGIGGRWEYTVRIFDEVDKAPTTLYGLPERQLDPW